MFECVDDIFHFYSLCEKKHMRNKCQEKNMSVSVQWMVSALIVRVKRKKNFCPIADNRIVSTKAIALQIGVPIFIMYLCRAPAQQQQQEQQKSNSIYGNHSTLTSSLKFCVSFSFDSF